jgi:hypothetical protein
MAILIWCFTIGLRITPPDRIAMAKKATVMEIVVNNGDFENQHIE